jgi:hypothetical protein
MGLISFLTNPVTNWLRAAQLQRTRQEQEAALLARTGALIEAQSNDADKSRGTHGGENLRDLEQGQGSWADAISANEYYEALKESFSLYLKHATYGGAIDAMTRFTVGHEFDVSAERREVEPGEDLPESEDAAAREAESYWWAFWRANEMQMASKEIVRRKLRDGDAFLCFADATRTGMWATPWRHEGVEYMVPRFQFLDPYRVTNPAQDVAAGKHPYGIEYAEGSKVDPVAYWYADARIPAALVLHCKGLGDSDWPRGVPALLRYAQTARKYERYLGNVEDKLEVANAWVLWINYANAAAAATGRAANLRSSDTDTDANRQKRLKGGTVLRTSGDTKAQFMGPSMDGARAEDGRVYDLQAARAAGLAENTVTGNAEHNNRASIEVAQDPQTRLIEDLQDQFACNLRRLWRLVIGYGKASGQIADACPDECTLEPPPIVSRNEFDMAKMLDLMSNHGLSRRTILQRAGFDPDLEAQQREIEAQAASATMGDDVDADGREDDLAVKGEEPDAEDASDGEEGEA